MYVCISAFGGSVSLGRWDWRRGDILPYATPRENIIARKIISAIGEPKISFTGLPDNFERNVFIGIYVLGGRNLDSGKPK